MCDGGCHVNVRNQPTRRRAMLNGMAQSLMEKASIGFARLKVDTKHTRSEGSLGLFKSWKEWLQQRREREKPYKEEYQKAYRKGKMAAYRQAGYRAGKRAKPKSWAERLEDVSWRLETALGGESLGFASKPKTTKKKRKKKKKPKKVVYYF